MPVEANRYRKISIVGKRMISVGSLLVLLIFTQFLAYQNYLLIQAEQRQVLINEINSVKERIESTLKSSYAVTSSFAFILDRYGFPEDFDQVAKVLLTNHSFIDVIQYVDKTGTITHVYPLEGNEPVIGYNILEDPFRKNEALKTIEKGDLYFAGPFELKQGGKAIVGRLPLFKNGNFNGFAAVIIKLNTLLSASNLTIQSDTDFVYQLSKINDSTGEEEFFLTTNEPINTVEYVKTTIEYGDWNLYAKPSRSLSLFRLLPLSILGIILSIIGYLFIRFMLKQPTLLTMQVTKITEELQFQSNRFRTLVENSSDVICTMRFNGEQDYVSPSINRVCGCPDFEFKTNNYFSIIHQDDLPQVKVQLETIKSGSSDGIVSTYRIKHKKGHWVWIESIFSTFKVGEDVYGIVNNFRDVSERIKYSDALNLQNEKLKEIAWTQSHVVRDPLSRLMSLINLLEHIDEIETDQETMLSMILKSAHDLDAIVKKIILKTEEIGIE